jgi:hypothetical protein
MANFKVEDKPAAEEGQSRRRSVCRYTALSEPLVHIIN